MRFPDEDATCGVGRPANALRVGPPGRSALAGILAAGLLLSCGTEPQQDAAAPVRPESAAPAEARPLAAAAKASPTPQRKERPLPAFGGRTLSGERLEISSLLGRRLLIFFFNPDVAESATVASAVQRIAGERGSQNFQILGVAMGAAPDRARTFVAEQGIEYPVLDDSNAQIANRLGLRVPTAMLGADAEGYVVFGMGQFPTDVPDPETAIEQQLRDSLRLPEPAADGPPGARPPAPLFEADLMDADGHFALSEQRGRAVVLVFFLHTCPHCHEFLEFMRDYFETAPENTRPVLVGVEVTGKTFAVRESLRKEGLDFFPVIFDDDGSIRSNYGVFAGVPDIVLIDAQGRIASRTRGWIPDADGPLLRMRMAKLSGAPVPMLLRPNGYSGSEACGVCHEREHRTWQITQHATAYDTLVKHGSNNDPECVGCHVVGFGQTGGFDLVDRQHELEDVGCETCHGRGGPHLSPQFVTGGDYSPVCIGCHDQKHSLGFEYATFLPQVSHAKNAEILALPEAERRAILAARGAVRDNLLPTAASHVGSKACRSCHEAEFATWSAGPHAAALASLERQGKQGEADCLPCHTTGFGKDGGFPAGDDVAAHPDLARVGCESCHGPGSEHVVEGADKLGSIVSLGDKCDSCVILQICGGCHDEANDPGFEFEVIEKIDAIRHGTIEAGTGKPLAPGGSAARSPQREPGDTARLLARAFAWADAAGEP